MHRSRASPAGRGPRRIECRTADAPATAPSPGDRPRLFRERLASPRTACCRLIVLATGADRPLALVLKIEPQPERITEFLRPIVPSHRSGEIVVIEERRGAGAGREI